jgi:signal transduction histidine kinase
VRDDGNGMDDATRQHAFLPFFTTRSKDQGTGLGLPVSQAIIEGHGGRISLESAPRGGTTVEIRLPVTSNPEQA